MHINNTSVLAENNKQQIMPSSTKNWTAANTAPNQVGTEEFLRILWPERSSTRGQLGICHSHGVTSWHDLSNEAVADAAEHALQGDTNVYYHCATHDTSLAEAQVNNDSATQLSFLWADIYLAKEVMTIGKNYPTPACAQEILERLPVPPSCIVDNNDQLHAYWFLNEPIDAQEHHNLPRVFQEYIRSQFVDKDTGEAYDFFTTYELSRTQPLPGTKDSIGGHIIEILSLRENRRYRVDQLSRLCPSVHSLTDKKTQHTKIELNVDADDKETAVVDELNLTHAIVHAGKTMMLREKHDPVFNRETFVLETIQSFKDWYANKKFGDELLSKIWLKHPHRRQYEGIVFSPEKDVAGHYNLFRGFPVEPYEGDCSRYLSLIKEIICNGNEEHYKYVLKWFAHIFQKPAELPGTALVMRGHQGTGKGTLTQYIGQLVGQHYLELVQMRQVTGNFNAHMKDTLLLHANEALWGGDKPAEGAIKAMITDEASAIEFKGKDIIMVKNYKRLVFASNNDWVVPRDMDCRRFFILDVSDAHKEDQEYFGAIHQQMQAGGLEALMHHLLKVDLDGFNPRVMPKTDGAGFDMKLKGMDSVMQWLYQILDDGELERMYIQDKANYEPWPAVYPKKQLHDLYMSWCKDQNIRHRETQATFGRALNKVLSKLPSPKIFYMEKRRYCYKLPSLEKCRTMFEQACKEGPSIWTLQENES